MDGVPEIGNIPGEVGHQDIVTLDTRSVRVVALLDNVDQCLRLQTAS